LNLGAGRNFKEVLIKINDSIKDKSFFKNKTLLDTISYVKKNKTNLHIIGMYSEEGVHSELNHLKALLKLVKNLGIKKCYLHVIADGRDTAPKKLKKYVNKIKPWTKKDLFHFATLSGRYYAMDRDCRWSRTKKAYQAIYGLGRKAKNIDDAIKKAYKNNETDEFIQPTVLDDYPGIKKNDGMIFFNYREDRMRQIVAALGLKKFSGFSRKKYVPIKTVCMYKYDNKFNLPVVFDKIVLKNTLSEIISKAGGKQFHIAETEKYAHVTYFFNGGREKKFNGETRIIIPSPKVATYDLKPEMNANKIKNRLLKEIGKKDFIVANFANGDMVGHTGKFKSAQKAVRTVDNCIKEIVNKCQEKNVLVVITADHGNCEEMSGPLLKCHSTNKVPFSL